MIYYTFKCEDTEEKTITEVHFATESDVWSGYNGPMWKFFDFLKGCGYVFDIHDEIGVLKKNDGFIPAAQ